MQVYARNVAFYTYTSIGMKNCYT